MKALQRDRVFKLAQDTTNELWAVTLRREYATPGEKKRAIEREVRAALENLAGIPSTVDGFPDGVDPILGEDAPRPLPNPYANTARMDPQPGDQS